MLDPDISTRDAIARLTLPDNDPSGLSRRRFLQLVGWGVGGGAALGGLGDSVLDSLLPGYLREANAAAPVAANEGILVVIGMYGGNDGLNTVVPFTDSSYYAQHGGLAVPAGQVLPLDNKFGLNPHLTELKKWWDASQLAVVRGVGMPDADLSHFNSMAYWMSGRRNGVPSSGWIGRWLDGLGGGADLYRAAAIGSGVPLHMLGEVRRASAVPPHQPGFGGDTEAADKRLYDAIHKIAAPGGVGPWRDAVALATRDQVDLAQRVTPLFAAALPDGEIQAKLEAAARLINANLGFRVFECSWGDFDSHSGQPTMHTARMTELNAGLARFFATLKPEWSHRVTVMTFSEFGRTSYANDSNGSDHGTANCAFVLGANVKGGLYGQQPSLASLGRWDRMGYTVDYRSLYTSVINGWLGGGASTVLGGTFEDLHLFRAGPGTGVPTPPLETGQFVPLTPSRIYDTRDGTGAAPRRLMNAGEVAHIQVTGRGGVPAANVTAVAVNITCADVTQPTYVSAYPTGQPAPETSNLNPLPGKATPNMVVVGLGWDGKIDVSNAVGQINCIVDVMGYFSKSGGSRITPVSPARVLDTRDGTGATRAKVVRNSPINVQVAGRGGVPASGVTAVVLNMTVTEPTGAGYLTVWPTGAARPYTSNLNFGPGETVPNLVMCKVGNGGKISVFTDGPDTHVIADVFAYFSGSGQRHTPVRPARLLDTRGGTGAPRQPVGAGNPVSLQVGGKGGVPANATGVVLNVTATGPTAWSYVTVWPTGGKRPDTSNLNILPGGTIANLVIVKLGAGGKVDLHNAFGTTELIADVLGYFRS